jgi:hypothetical protein
MLVVSWNIYTSVRTTRLIVQTHLQLCNKAVVLKSTISGSVHPKFQPSMLAVVAQMEDTRFDSAPWEESSINAPRFAVCEWPRPEEAKPLAPEGQASKQY